METTDKSKDWEQQLPLHWYTLALILILILQIFICCGIYMWANSKLKKMKTEQERQSTEFYEFLLHFNRMMKLEEDQYNMIIQPSFEGRTPK